MRSVSGETKAASERFLELRIIAADGSEGTGYRLRPEVLKNLPALFRTLPDNHYALYLVNLETNARRLVIEVYVRNGKVIDPGDDSEGTRDRPPTDEQSSTPLGEQPAVEDASDRSAEPSAAKQASHSGNSAKHPAAALADNVPWSQQSIGIAAGRSGKLSQWTALAVGLAASANAQNWAKQVDEALAQATAQQWRKLQLHIPKKRKNP